MTGPVAVPPGGSPAELGSVDESSVTTPAPTTLAQTNPAPTTLAPLLPPVPRTPIWPRPDAGAAGTVCAAAGAAGVSAGVALPWFRVGVGWVLVGLVIAGLGVVVAVRHPAPPPASAGGGARPARSRLASTLWAAGALALLAVLAVRASGWLALLCVLGAALAGSLAVAGGRTVRGLLAGALAVPAMALGALPWARRGLAARARPGGSDPARLAAAVAAAAVLLAVFAPLLASADPAFAKVLDTLLPVVDPQAWRRWGLLCPAVALGMLGASCLLAGPARPDPDRPRPRWRVRRIEWGLPVGLLVALFTVFVVVQLSVLFGGADYVTRTTGLTYAEYARSGFWQLLIVTMATLAVIGVAARYAVRDTAADRVWLRALLGGLAALTLVIVASALSRMWAYQQAYGFTVLRLLVYAIELWLGLVYLLVIAAGYRLRAGWLPRAVAGTGLAALLALAALDPEGFVAEHNVTRWQQTGRIDLRYLAGLSADAAPALDRLPEPKRSCALAAVSAAVVHDPGDWRRWNAARATARRIGADITRPASGCDDGR